MLGVLVLIGMAGDDPVRAAGCLQCCARAAAKHGRPARSAPVVGLSRRAWECTPTFRPARNRCRSPGHVPPLTSAMSNPYTTVVQWLGIPPSRAADFDWVEFPPFQLRTCYVCALRIRRPPTQCG